MAFTLPRSLREAAFLSQFDSVGCGTLTSSPSDVALIPPSIRSTIRSRNSSLYVTIVESQSRPQSDQTEATTILTPGESADNRADAWNVQDTLLTPTDVYIESDHLILACENQGVFRWAIALASLREPDPAVVIFAPGSEDHLEAAAPSVTEFAAWWLLLNAKFSSRPLYRANGQVEEAVLDAVERCVPRLPVPDIAWHVSPMRLHGDAELIVEVHDFTWIWVTARHPTPFESVVCASEAAGMTWESLERPR